MKILFIANGNSMDYQCDSLLIGLKELFGADVVDPLKHWHLYDTYPAEDARGLYGKGMTMTRVLPDLSVDRAGVEDKVRDGFYDLVVYGSIVRNYQILDLVRRHYAPEQVALVDGEDDPMLRPVMGFGMHYFKRELAGWAWPSVPVHPIGFGIPTCKLGFSEPKTRDVAICDPRDTSTYIYDDEASYYRGYGEARFGVTIKKAGWDCMRHYEILANGCIPLFLDVAGCPDGTMAHFPKQRCAQVLDEIQAGEPPADVYARHAAWFRDYTERHLTTRALATRFLGDLGVEAAHVPARQEAA